MAKHVIEIDRKCEACKGTGVYVGIAERDGFGVVCNRCGGDGHYMERIQYEDFEKRERREDVVTILQRNPGFVAAGDPKSGRFGGIPYDDWLAGKGFPPGSEMREFSCPAWFYMKVVMEKCYDSLGMRYSKCPHFGNKAQCWIDWDNRVPEGEEKS